MTEIPRDCLTPVLGALFVALGLVAVLVALLVSDPKRDAVMVGARMVSPPATLNERIRP